MDFEFIEKCYKNFSQNTYGGDQNPQQNVAFNKKIAFEIFWVCLKLCSFFDFEFIAKFH